MTVIDNHDGTLTATAKYDDADSLTITNTYSAEGTLTVEAKKTVDGKPANNDQVFDFVLKDSGGEVIVVESNDNGSITFADVASYTLDDVGTTFTYTLTETGEYSGYITDSTSVTVTVTLEDNHDGTLKVVKVYKVNDEEVDLYTFNNVSLSSLIISKQAEGGDEEDVFPFQIVLTDASGEAVTEEFNYAVFNGGVTDDAPEREGKLVSGGIIELKRDQTAVISDVPTGTVATVTELDDGTLHYTTTVDGVDGRETEVAVDAEGTTVAFVNTLITKDFTCWKVWEGADGGTITLTLYREDADGKLVALDPQPEYTGEDGQYIFKDLPAKDPDGSDIIYAAKEKPVSGYITVYDNSETTEEGRSGKSNAVYDNGTILNRAVTSIRVRKVWSGSNNHPAITLTLYCNGTEYDAKYTGPDADGWYRWSNLPVVVNGKTAVYTVKETPLWGWTTSYRNSGAHTGDKTQAYNGGTIVNHTVPRTGDRTPTTLLILLAALSAAGLGSVILFNRRRARR